VLKDSFNTYINNKEVKIYLTQLTREALLNWKIKEVLEAKNFYNSDFKVKYFNARTFLI
jgi:hypothetical protein